ncbi:hypothetical protein Tco_0766572 [Tanacetum coccineum]
MLRNVSAMSVNDLYQPWRAILSMINMYLTSKTAGHYRSRHLVLQILWGIIHRSNIDYKERIWEEFVQSIQTFLTEKKRLTMTLRKKKKSAPLLILSIRFTKLIIHHLNTKHNIHPRTGSPLHYSYDDNVLGNLRFVGKDGREVFGMPILDALLTDAIKRAPYYGGYLAHVAEYQQHLDGEHGMAEEGAVPESPAPKATKVTKPVGDKTPKPTSCQPPKPTPAPTKPSKAVPEKKQKLVMETPDEPLPAKRSKAGLVGKRRKPKSPLKLVDEFVDEGVPMSEPRIVDEEADYQRAVQGKGKEKVIEEQAAHDLLTFQTLKKQSPADQFIFQRRTPTTTEPSGNAESPSLDAELAIADSETEIDKEVTPINQEKYASNKELIKINAGVQDEGQAGPDPSKQDEGLAGSNPGNAAVFQPQPSHVIHVGPNLEPMDLAVSDSSTQQNPKQLDEEFTTTAYPNVQENLKLPTEDQFFIEKPQEEESEKTNAKSEVQSMVTVPIHQDTSSVPPITTLVIDLITSQADSLTGHAPLLTSTSTTTTITTTTLPPPPLQPQHSTTDPIIIRRIGELKQHMKVSKAVDKIVTDAVDWALQAPLRARFKDLPEADMKEILLQRMWETGSHKTHEDHKNLYKALEKSMDHDHPDQLQADLAKARKKRRKRSDSPKTPYGSPPPPPAGAFGAPGTSRASGSSQLTPPPPPPSIDTNRGNPQQSTFTATQETSPTDNLINDDSIPDEQVHLYYDEDIGNDHLPKADMSVEN